MVVRIGLRLAFTRSIDHRWRQIAMPLSACVSLLLVLFGIGLIEANSRQAHRIANRMPILAEAPTAQDIRLLPRADVATGKQYLTIWISPPAQGSAPLPPGLSRFPKPGEAFVSPSLAALIESDSEFGRRYPSWELISEEGLVAADERLAYVGLPDDRVPERAYNVVGFGPTSPGERALQLTLSNLPDQKQLVVGVTLFAFIPALILLYLGTSSGSAIREHRFLVLHWLGASPRLICLVAAVEAAILVLPGLLLAAVVWLLVEANLGPLPVIWMDPLPGDFALPLWQVLVASLGAIMAALGLTMAELSGVGLTARRTRPVASKAHLQDYRAYPVVLGTIILLARPWLSEGKSDAVLIAAMALFLVGVPLIAPVVVRQTGRLVARVRTVPTLLAGSRLEWDPLRNARPHMAAATLVALTLTVLGYQKLTDVEIRRSQGAPVGFVTVSLGVNSTAELESFKDQLRPAVVAVLREDANRWILNVTCEDLAPHLGGVGCDKTDPTEFDATGEARALASLGLPPQLDIVFAPDLRFAEDWHAHAPDASPAHDHDATTGVPTHHHDSLLVIDGTSTPSALETKVGTLSTLALPGSNVVGESRFRLYYPPAWSWTIAGLALAAVTLALATALPIMDRLTATRVQRRHLVKIGVTERRLRMLEGLLFGIPYVLVVGVGLAAGSACCWLLLSQSHPRAPIPWTPIVWLLAVTSGFGLLGSFALAAFGIRSSSPENRD